MEHKPIDGATYDAADEAPHDAPEDGPNGAANYEGEPAHNACDESSSATNGATHKAADGTTYAGAVAVSSWPWQGTASQHFPLPWPFPIPFSLRYKP